VSCCWIRGPTLVQYRTSRFSGCCWRRGRHVRLIGQKMRGPQAEEPGKKQEFGSALFSWLLGPVVLSFFDQSTSRAFLFQQRHLENAISAHRTSVFPRIQQHDTYRPSFRQSKTGKCKDCISSTRTCRAIRHRERSGFWVMDPARPPPAATDRAGDDMCAILARTGGGC